MFHMCKRYSLSLVKKYITPHNINNRVRHCYTIIHKAIKYGDSKIFKYLLTIPNVNIDYQSILSYIIIFNNKKMLKVVFNHMKSKNININFYFNINLTMLLTKDDMFKMFIKYGLDVNHKYMKFILNDLYLNKKYDDVKYLLMKGAQPPNITSPKMRRVFSCKYEKYLQQYFCNDLVKYILDFF